MTLIKFNPFEELDLMNRNIRRFFDDFTRFEFAPRVDVKEDEKNITINAEIPGVTKNDIEVKFENGLLSIKGEKKNEVEKKEEKFYSRERSFGSFVRTFRLTNRVDSDNISANFENGVLTVVVPKVADKPVETKSIEIK